MFDRLVQKKRQEEGFTLIELLIVIIILGILAAVVVFGVSAFRDDSVSKACKTDMKSVETAGQAYVAKVGSPAADMDALKTGGYLRDVPSSTDYTITYATTPATGTPTNFTVSGTKTSGGAC